MWYIKVCIGMNWPLKMAFSHCVNQKGQESKTLTRNFLFGQTTHKRKPFQNTTVWPSLQFSQGHLKLFYMSLNRFTMSDFLKVKLNLFLYRWLACSTNSEHAHRVQNIFSHFFMKIWSLSFRRYSCVFILKSAKVLLSK